MNCKHCLIAIPLLMVAIGSMITIVCVGLYNAQAFHSTKGTCTITDSTIQQNVQDTSTYAGTGVKSHDLATRRLKNSETTYRAYFEVEFTAKGSNQKGKAAVAYSNYDGWQSHSKAQSKIDNHPINSTIICTSGENTIDYDPDDTSFSIDLIILGDYQSEMKKRIIIGWSIGFFLLAMSIAFAIICFSKSSNTKHNDYFILQTTPS